MCEMFGQFIQKKHEEEQAVNARYWKIPACCDDDDDYNFAITPNKPIDSLSMGDEHLNTILATESDEFIKSCVENLVANPSESKGENGCDVSACFTTLSNILFDLCGNDAHYGYNCPPKVPIIPDPESFNNHTIKELPPTVQSFDPKSDLVYNSPNVFSPSLQPSGYSYEFCGSDAYYGQDGSLQVSFTYDPEPCYNQDFNFLQNYSYDLYGNDSHFGYDCQPQFSLNYESKPGYIEN
nr:hypothetical protein [Tanacetum cinerariifolium]